MKILCLLLIAATAFAEEPLDPKPVVSESAARDSSGKPARRIEGMVRGKTPVLQTWHETENGVTKITTRGYFVGGELIMTEADEDGDGTLETLAIYNPAKRDMDVFIRGADGSVKPVDAKTLAAYKEQNAAMRDFWASNPIDKNDPEKFPEAAKALRQRLKAAEAQKKQPK